MPQNDRMSISLVSAPVLGFDLVRHPAGDGVAQTLLIALSLGPEDLPAFVRVAGSLQRSASGALAPRLAQARSEVVVGSLSGSALLPEPEAADAGSLGGMISTLRRSMITDLDDLEHLVRSDVLSWAVEGGSVDGGAPRGPVDPETLEVTVRLVVQALAADWIDGLDPQLRAELAAGFRQVTESLPSRRFTIGPCAPELTAVLHTLRTLDADGRDRLRQVNSLLGPGGSEWAQAVHEASWAAFTTGRIRAAASAQLLATQAFRAGGLDAADGAEGVWNMISGHVQACVVADVLPSDVQHRLARGWRSALGPAV